MRLCSLSFVFLYAIFLSIANSQAAIIPFDIQGRAGAGMLSGNEIHAINGTPGSGGEVGAGITFNDATRELTLNVGWGSGASFTNLTGNVTVAHIHGPTASAGVASFNETAGVRYNLDGTTTGFNGSATNGGWTNTIVVINEADVAGLLAGRFYLNVHTAANTAGEIRGNLVAVPEPTSLCLLGLATAGFAVRSVLRKKRTPKLQSNA